METNDVIFLSDLNLAESHREFARWHQSSEIVEANDLLITAGADVFPAANFVMRIGPTPIPAADEMLEQISIFYKERGRSFSVYVRRHIDSDLAAACEAREMVKISSPPGMCLDAPLPDRPIDDAITLRVVEDERGAADFADVAVASFKTLGLPEECGRKMFAMPARMIKPHIIAVVAYHQDKPVSTALALMSHGIAGIYWVGTKETHRKQGLAEICTRMAGNKAFAGGAARVILQASHMGEPVYRRMGYREVTKYSWYMWFNK
ncbi:MAG: hypothetical protein SWH61_06720 [Thermodesulfobacteriota bacterium]|nr:hypothetical protein [Thermodesulfobacteriota bacterium]